jgi:hypothetical protein
MSSVPLILTGPLDKKTTGRCDFMRWAGIVIITPTGMVIEVKLKTLSPAALRLRATGLKGPLTVGLYAPSAPVELQLCPQETSGTRASSTCAAIFLTFSAFIFLAPKKL